MVADQATPKGSTASHQPGKGCAALADAYPAVFNWDHPAPLARGICAQLLASTVHGLSKREVRSALRTWCHRPAYHQAMLEGAVRLDLNGQSAGEILPAERAHASAQLLRFGDSPAKLLRGRDPQGMRRLQLCADNLSAAGRPAEQIAEELGLTTTQVSRLVAGHQRFVEASRALVRFCDDQLLGWAQAAGDEQPRVLAFVGGGSGNRLWQLLQALRGGLHLVRKIGTPMPQPLPPVVAVAFLGTGPAAVNCIEPLAAAAWQGRTRLLLCVEALDDLSQLGIEASRCAVLMLHEDLVSARFTSGGSTVEHRPVLASGSRKRRIS
jgi:hypothetical protein